MQRPRLLGCTIGKRTRLIGNRCMIDTRLLSGRGVTVSGQNINYRNGFLPSSGVALRNKALCYLFMRLTHAAWLKTRAGHKWFLQKRSASVK